MDCLQDISLWTSYALVEGASGHMDTARKVLDTTLASLPALQNVWYHAISPYLEIINYLYTFNYLLRRL